MKTFKVIVVTAVFLTFVFSASFGIDFGGNIDN